MATILKDLVSVDPNQTSGKENNPISSISYPVSENLPMQTRLRFVEYNRFTPSDPGQDETTSIVSLPLPITVPDNYGILTNGTNLDIYGNINQKMYNNAVDIINNGINAESITKLGNSINAESLQSKRFPGDKLVAGIAALGNNSSIGQAAQALTGIIQNPHATVMFNGVALRNINLEWRVSPRSQADSDALHNVFNTIKLRAHPEEIGDGYALNYPDLVYVEFTGKASKYLPKFQKAFINNINITPDAPAGSMSLFKSGAPVIYTMQLSMTEISILTRNILADQMGITNGNT